MYNIHSVSYALPHPQCLLPFSLCQPLIADGVPLKYTLEILTLYWQGYAYQAIDAVQALPRLHQLEKEATEGSQLIRDIYLLYHCILGLTNAMNWSDSQAEGIFSAPPGPFSVIIASCIIFCYHSLLNLCLPILYSRRRLPKVIDIWVYNYDGINT